MKYRRFEELPVWQDAIELAVKVFVLTAKPALRRYRSLRDQIERSSVSVSNNIAEGFERGTTQELLSFLYIARGSAGETRSVSILMQRFPNLSTLFADLADIKIRSEKISRQLRAWCASLQDCDLPGQRYLNTNSRRRSQEAKEREEFLRELEQIKEGGKTNASQVES